MPIRARHPGRFAGASLLAALGVLFLLAGLVEGEMLAFFWAAVFLGPAFLLVQAALKLACLSLHLPASFIRPALIYSLHQ